jgi:hypothetical protein
MVMGITITTPITVAGTVPTITEDGTQDTDLITTVHTGTDTIGVFITDITPIITHTVSLTHPMQDTDTELQELHTRPQWQERVQATGRILPTQQPIEGHQTVPLQ